MEWTLLTSGLTPRARHGLPTAVALLACATTALTAFPGPASADVGTSLAERLQTAGVDERIPVLVTLNRQVDGERFDGDPQALIMALQRTADATQPEVLENVDAPAQRFWLVNAVAVRATPGEIATLNTDPAVARVDEDTPVAIAADTPDIDTFPNAQGGDWGLSALRVPQVWRQTGMTGRGVVIGSIDTGVDTRHADLTGKVVAWRDFVNDRPAPYDDNGHGTHTIGTMVGGSEGGAPIGVAPGARVIVAKAIGASGVGPGSSLMAAAEWMTDPDGDPETADQPVAINNSWSAARANDPWFRSIIRRWVELGITPVFASGNTGPDAGSVGSPAGYPESLAVGATDDTGALADFSSRGPITWLDLDGLGPARGTVITKPDVVGPGVNITSSVKTGYVSFTGTSMASPHVAGIIALMAQANPEARGEVAARIIRETAIDVGAPGTDQRTGHGRADALNAVRAVLGPSNAIGEAEAPDPADTAPEARFTRSSRVITRRRYVRLRVNVYNSSAVRWRVNGTAWSEPRYSLSLRVKLRAGRNVVQVQAVGDGEVDNVPARRVVVLDRTPPRVRVRARRRGTSTVLVAQVSDRVSKPDLRSIRWTLDNGVRARGRSVNTHFTGATVRRVQVSVRDRAGNVARVLRRIRVAR